MEWLKREALVVEKTDHITRHFLLVYSKSFCIKRRKNMPTRFKLNTGAFIPAIGFGTWQDEHAQEKAVEEAISAGYHHIDTAQA